MAYPTYTFLGPSASEKDKFRFEIQDVGDNNYWQYADEDIVFMIDEYGYSKAKLKAVEQLKFKYASLKDEKTDKVDVKYSQLYAQYKSLYDDLLRSAGRYGIPFAGGISKQEKLKTNLDCDNIGSAFKINDDDPEDLDNVCSVYDEDFLL